MANNDETFVLVEIEAIATPTAAQDFTLKRDVIKRIVRGYLSRSRADEDLMLLRDALPGARFDIQPLEYIDN